MKYSMLAPDIQKYINDEISKQVNSPRNANAGRVLFDQNTGLTTQGQNVKGLFGNGVDHNTLRLKETTQTIVSGVVRSESASMLIDTESAASTDDLDTIHPTPFIRGGEIILIRPADTTHTVVVNNGTGNLNLKSDFEMTTTEDSMWLRWDQGDEEWVELWRNDSRDGHWTSSTASSLWDQSSSSPTLGLGTIERRSFKTGNKVSVEFTLTIGSDTTLGVGAFLFDLKYPTSANIPLKAGFSGFAFDSSANKRYYIGGIANPSSSDLVGQIKLVSGTAILTGSLSQLAPFTFASGDWVILKGDYEID